MAVRPREVTDTRAKLLPRITGYFFDRPWMTAAIWFVLVSFGILSFTFLLRREGFPNISIPIVVVNGSYAVNDAGQVDQTLGREISQLALKQPNAKSVVTQSQKNFFSATIQYNEGTDANQAKAALQKAVQSDSAVPKSADLTYAAPYYGVTGGSLQKIDATIALYDVHDTKNLQQLTMLANQAVRYLNDHKAGQVDQYFVISPFQRVTNPATGQRLTVQRNFDRYGVRQGADTNFYQSVTIGVSSINNPDVLKMDKQIRDQLSALRKQSKYSDVGIAVNVTASYAPQINAQIGELQRVLLEGLAAVLIIGSIVIAVRASLVTVISMLTVISITLGLIYLLGYTLNVITLFALILSLSLIVDDTIIMVEAIDSAKRHITDRGEVIREAARKIGLAMLAATLTSTLSFVPLAFVSGVLGSFIRAIPVTIIVSLLVSLAAALIFIPLFSRYLLLGKRAMKVAEKKAKKRKKAPIEVRLARHIATPMLWAQHNRTREIMVGIVALCIGAAFIGDGVFVFLKVPFNIFPQSRDTNQLSVKVDYPPNTTIDQAESIAGHVDQVTAGTLGKNMQWASYYGSANAQSATLYVNLIPYGQRQPTAPQLASDVQAKFKHYQPAKVTAQEVDVVPSAAQFTVNIHAADRGAAEKLAHDMADYLKGQTLKGTGSSAVKITDTAVSDPGVFVRQGNEEIISVTADFSATSTTELINKAQALVTDHYTPARLHQFGLGSNAISYDLGQESDNQKSFQALLYAFPVVLIAIYILLGFQLRSFLQPLLIFMALPFSFLGISLGLYITDNPFSFFAMLGFFALIGLSIKNSILLTDYANQARRLGMTPADAVVAALGERFRPLVATSLTAVFSLLPLAMTSPFWQGLAVVLIGGLLSSTLLVIFIFPYYYLAFEYVRIQVHERFHWLKRA